MVSTGLAKGLRTGYSHYGYIFDPIQDIVEIIRRLPGQ